jgi:hypothetical protein
LVSASDWGSEGRGFKSRRPDEAFASCGARLQTYRDDPFVTLSRLGDEGVGEAWVRVRVPEVRGRVTRVSAAKTEDCSPSDLTWRKRRSIVSDHLRDR